MYKLTIAIILSGLFLTRTAYSQKILSLDDAINTALKKSYDIINAEYYLTISQNNLKVINHGLLPSVNLEFDLPKYSSRLSSQFNPETGKEQFYNFGYSTIESRLSITQPILFTNGTISLNGSLFSRDQFSDNTGTTRDYFGNFSIYLRQPLWGFNNQSASLKKAEISLTKAERNFTKIEQDIIYNVTLKYYYLLKSKKSLEISKENFKQIETAYQISLNKYKAGLIAEVDVLQLEIDLAQSKNELLDLEKNLQESKNDFKIIIGLELDKDFEIQTEISYVPINVDLEKAIENAFKSRSDLRNIEDDIMLSNINVDEIDSRNNVKAEILANYGFSKNDKELGNVFHQFYDNKYIALTISIPLLDWGKNKIAVESAVAENKISQLSYSKTKQTIKNEIISSANNLASTMERLRVLSKSIELAEKSYKISVERFNAGNITSLELSQTQLKLMNTKTNSLNALIDYKLAVADFERKTLLKLNIN